MISPGHQSGLQSHQTDIRDVSEESVMSLEPDRERSGSLGNVFRSVEWLRWLRWLRWNEGRRKVKGKHDKGPADILLTRSAGYVWSECIQQYPICDVRDVGDEVKRG
jgi:hypothetical protein